MKELETPDSSLGWGPPLHAQPKGSPVTPLRCPEAMHTQGLTGQRNYLFFALSLAWKRCFVLANHTFHSPSPTSVCNWGAHRLPGGQASNLAPGKWRSEFSGGQPYCLLQSAIFLPWETFFWEPTSFLFWLFFLLAPY